VSQLLSTVTTCLKPASLVVPGRHSQSRPCHFGRCISKVREDEKSHGTCQRPSRCGVIRHPFKSATPSRRGGGRRTRRISAPSTKTFVDAVRTPLKLRVADICVVRLELGSFNVRHLLNTTLAPGKFRQSVAKDRQGRFVSTEARLLDLRRTTSPREGSL
jgi:hypothetical protein